MPKFGICENAAGEVVIFTTSQEVTVNGEKVSVSEHELHHTDVCQGRAKYNSGQIPKPITALRDL